MSLESFTAADLERVVRVYTRALRSHRAALNRLNVYPVPDGDTGTNMCLTLESVDRELDEAAAVVAPGTLGINEVAAALSHGSLMGARGNSGVILSQILRGMASELRQDIAGPSGAGAASSPCGQAGVITAAVLAGAFSRASFSAYAAVSNPVEGTILSVAAAAARGAAEALSSNPGATLLEVLEASREVGARALAATTAQLEALELAGVVDAGGAGLLLLVDSFLHVIDGRDIPSPPLPAGTGPAMEPHADEPSARTGDGPGALRAREDATLGEPGVADLRYEVMFLLEAPDEAIAGFRGVWANCGGSIVIVGGDGLYNCHIHTDDVGGAIEAATEIGRPRRIRVTDLADQVAEELWVREAVAGAGHEEPVPEAVTCAVVAVCAGEGVKRIFRSLGASRIVSGGQSANPSTADLLHAIAAANAEQVVVLPNNSNVVPVAEQAAAHAPKKVRVVPTAGISEGFAALLAYDPEADVDTNAESMAAAASHVVSGEIAQASRDAMTPAGRVRSGDWLGMSREAVKVVAPGPSTPADAALALLAMLVPESGDHEIVTIIEGEGAHPSGTRRIVDWLSMERPRVTPEVHHGGQPLYPYIFSIE